MITYDKKVSRTIIIIVLVIVTTLSIFGTIKLIDITTNFWIKLPHYLGVALSQPDFITYKPDLAKRLKEQNINAIVYSIYGLESTWGKNDNCRKQGKYNGYGYGVHNNGSLCFDSHEQARLAVVNWVTQRYDWQLSTLLCFYNQGRIMKDCNYYQNYLRLN